MIRKSQTHHSHRWVPLAMALALVAALPAAAEPLFAERPEVAPDLLLWVLPEELAATGFGELPAKAEVLIDGRVVFTESFRLAVEAGDDPAAVELLPQAPLKRRGYLALATNSAVEARLQVGDRELGVRPLRELAASGHALGGGSMRLAHLRYAGADDAPQSAAPLEKLFAAVCSAEHDNCVNNCYNDYYTCTYNNCSPEMPPRICDRCDTIYDSCLANCPPCNCPGPSVSYRYETYFVGYTGESVLTCYEDLWENDYVQGHYYQRYKQTWRKDKIEVTEHCDGTITEQVVQSTYSYTYCWVKQTGWTCNYPFQRVPSICW